MYGSEEHIHEMRQLCERHKLELRLLNHGQHWQIVGGPIIVNYYPVTGTVYVDGTKKGFNGSPNDAIQAAINPPPITKNRDKRRGERSRKRLRRRLFKRQKKCHWCPKVFANAGEATIDHVKPIARGGLDNENNIVLACKKCNDERGSDMPEVARHTVDPLIYDPDDREVSCDNQATQS